MKSTKIFALVLVAVMCFSMLASCGLFPKPDQGNNPPVVNPPADSDEIVIKEGDYTYNSYSSALGSNWNPHTWENNSDSSLLSYVTDGFVGMAPLDTEEGLYQWTFNMATSIEDVIAANQADLTKYGSQLPEGVTDASEVTEGYVYEIKLNPNAKWQTGELINADSYIYSMEKLLNSKYRNYRANLYISGESAVAGGLGYYNSEFWRTIKEQSAAMLCMNVLIYKEGQKNGYY
jgi:ABC-type transport system substrate-binding protein